MRAVLIVIGAVLIIGGLWATLGHGSITQTHTLVQVGSAKLTDHEHTPIPEWAGISAIVVGALLAIGGFATKR